MEFHERKTFLDSELQTQIRGYIGPRFCKRGYSGGELC